MKGIRLRDDFDRRALLLQQQGKLNAPPGSPPSLYSRNGPWSGSNELGQVQPFKPDANRRQTILKMDEWGFPELWTIRLGIDGQPTGFFDGYGIRATINTGVGGASQTIICDWLNGTEIAIPMNAVNVIAEYQSVSVAEGENMRLSVTLARGARSSGMRPRYTIVENETLPASPSSLTYALPPFVSRVTALPTSTPIANYFTDQIQMSLISGDGFGNHVTGLLGFGDRVTALNGLPATIQSRAVLIENFSANAVKFTLFCELFG